MALDLASELVRNAASHPLVQKPLLDLLGQECFITLFDRLEPTSACLHVASQKVLGLGLVVGGGIVKIPQIVTILRAKSARGLSFSSYLLDTASLLIYISYNRRNGFPFISYGENTFLLVQNMVILALIIAFGTSQGRTSNLSLFSINLVLAGIAGSLTLLMNPNLVSPSALQALMAAAIPLGVASKIPQILANLRAHSTGQLSAFLVAASFIGCLARVYTTTKETGDPYILFSFGLQTLLNGVLLLQIVAYGNQPTARAQSIPSVVVAGGSPPVPATKASSGPATPARVASPTPRSASKQWVRKAD